MCALRLFRRVGWLCTAPSHCWFAVACESVVNKEQISSYHPTVQGSTAGRNYASIYAHSWPLYSVRMWSSSPPPLGGSSVVTFPLAQTGEGISECELVQWFVKEGDVVNEFDRICEVQSDKASIEITSRYAGRVVKLHHAKGSIVKVGGALVDIELTSQTVEAVNIPVSHPGPGSQQENGNATLGPAPGQWASQSEGTLASPAVRRFAKELNLDLRLVTGTGPQGRILKEDLLRYAEKNVPAAQPTATAAAGPAPNVASPVLPSEPPGVLLPIPVAAVMADGESCQASESYSKTYNTSQHTKIPIRGYRRAMVKSMTEAATIPHFHYSDEVLMNNLVAVREALKGHAALQGCKLTFLPFIIKAASLALHEYPGLNCSLSLSANELIQHHTHNIGVAMNTPHGLVVPNIKHVQQKSIAEIAIELSHLQESAAKGKLSASQVSGGTLTVSNIGTIGGTVVAPLVNSPEVAIVGIGRLQHLPRFDSHGNVVSHAIMHASWGADHRAVDGATVARFSNAWKSYLEEPARLLLQLR